MLRWHLSLQTAEGVLLQLLQLHIPLHGLCKQGSSAACPWPPVVAVLLRLAAAVPLPRALLGTPGVGGQRSGSSVELSWSPAPVPDSCCAPLSSPTHLL